MKRKAAMLLLSLLVPCAVTGCPPTPTPDPKPVPEPVDAGDTLSPCAMACARAKKLGCDFAKPTAAGHTCTTVCKNAQKFEMWDLACRAKAASCAAWDACAP